MSFTCPKCGFAPTAIAPNHPTKTGRKVVKARTQQKQGYIEIPRAVWLKAGFRSGDNYIITIHGESLTIIRNERSSKYYARCQKFTGISGVVPMAERFRINPSSLFLSNLSGHEVDFSAFTDKIVVSKKV